MSCDPKAKELLDQRAIELAQAICDASNCFEDARRFYMSAVALLHRRVCMGLISPKFEARAGQHKQEIAARAIEDANATLVEQLGQLGIDHEPVFADRPIGGD